MPKKKPNRRWLQEQNNDIYVKQARDSHYRSRAVYKLQEIDRKDKLLRHGACVVDLGAAPGSWSQYAVERVGDSGRVIAVDLLEIAPPLLVDVVRVAEVVGVQPFNECYVIDVRGHLHGWSILSTARMDIIREAVRSR